MILYIYLSCRKEFVVGYDGLVIITSEKIYILNLENIETISPIFSQNIIYDFTIVGKNYLTTIDYDYNIFNKLANETIKNLSLLKHFIISRKFLADTDSMLKHLLDE